MTHQQDSNKQNKNGEKYKFAASLTSAQRSILKGMAHSLRPLIQIGTGGMSENLVKELTGALQAHELIKIQLPGQSDAATKKTETEALTATLPPHTHVVGRIGRTVILYLEKSPSEEPKIKLRELK